MNIPTQKYYSSKKILMKYHSMFFLKNKRYKNIIQLSNCFTNGVKLIMNIPNQKYYSKKNIYIIR